MPMCVVLSAAILLFGGGCDGDQGGGGSLEAVWGRQGVAAGMLQKPRALAIDAEDQIYIVDMTARIQVFNPEGEYVRGWSTPEHTNGRPTGLAIDQEGNLLVADTHYYRVLIYSPQGELLRSLGNGQGTGPGEFGLVTDAAQDSDGFYYVAEYGEFDRVQKFTAAGEFVLQWGGHGSAPGELLRPQKLAIDSQGQIWVADACNHRIQVFSSQGELVKWWGSEGSRPGELYYPYDLVLDGAGHVYVAEFGNHRVQKFTLDGNSLGCWGRHGRQPGELANPWGIVLDSRGRLFVLDTLNHRVQRIVL